MFPTLAEELLALTDRCEKEKSVFFRDVAPKKAIHAAADGPTLTHIQTALYVDSVWF